MAQYGPVPRLATTPVTRQRLLRRGLRLEYATLAWNVVGSVVLLAAAVAVGSLALAGFGVDSVIEIVASAVVVWQLKGTAGDARDRRALRVIATACPYCAVMMSDGIKALAEAGEIVTRDIAELVEASLD